ncbi:hypothetical protein N6H14_29450 [Paenibacillus sp. CC-CFT747]|nr:hypothetical protein N6H14_29450 [Paenibacillus sp. CC-CFT747]
MYQRDYILRMIEQITTAIATISGLRKEQKQQQAFDLLEELLNRHFRLNSKLLTSLSERDIIGILQKDGVVESEKVLILAAMLKEEGICMRAWASRTKLTSGI